MSEAKTSVPAQGKEALADGPTFFTRPAFHTALWAYGS